MSCWSPLPSKKVRIIQCCKYTIIKFICIDIILLGCIKDENHSILSMHDLTCAISLIEFICGLYCLDGKLEF
jgi:hypothetical protein